MKNSSRFFCNKDCEYYPCHEGIEEINCLFCYCPFYNRENCPGAPKYIEKNGIKKKSCMNCSFPHRAENIDKIIDLLRSS